MVITKSPLRISLVGGGSDMPAFYRENIGGVISFSINKYVYVSVNKKFDKKIRISYSKTENVDELDEIQHDLARECLREYKINDSVEVTSVSDIPGEGSGLGSSSAFTVGLVNALGAGGHPAMLAERAFRIESELCGHPAGKQDMYASAYGGMNYIRFYPKRVEVQTLFPKKDMEENFLLLYTGITRSANDILKIQSDNFKKGDTVSIGKELANIAYLFRSEYLEGMTYKSMGEYMDVGWRLKRRLSSVSSDEIDRLYRIGITNGAYGGKLLGAGGGGFMFFIAPFETHAKITEATGLRRVDFKIENMGSEIIYNGQT